MQFQELTKVLLIAISTYVTSFITEKTAGVDSAFMKPESYTTLESLFKKTRLQVKNQIYMQQAHVSDRH